MGICLFFCQKPTALDKNKRDINRRILPIIGKSQQEIILAIILACPIVGMLLLFGLGLSDITYQGVIRHIIGQQPKYPKFMLNTAKSGITDTQ